jgi:uncharacterized membrane protein YqgA involved in biofilm formation
MSKQTLLIFQCVKVVSGIVGTSLVFTQKYPIATVVILAIGAAANEIINFSNKHLDHDTTDPSNS